MTAANFSVYGWSNGGYSDDPSNPKYGTHDWIAHHALDWLPQKEKWFIVRHLANYLYGTELPDNGAVPGGIGDTGKHHVYYFRNGSLQDDASAVRAEEEYWKAVSYFKVGDLANTSLRLGVMTHYISDVAVFGHVMGANTDWGAEVHHSDYESYVETRTNSYEDDFNIFLSFDGALTRISAYNATLMLASDTTFGGDKNLRCTWMDQNYNWSNPTFKNRCGESLNLAVNLIADVLHTFYLELRGVAHYIDVPFHYQDTDYYCGPACLEMVFDYYGEDINQSEIADVARTIGEPVYSTFTDELRRAAHFSNISTSTGAEIPDHNISGYTLRDLGYAAFEAYNMDLTQLQNYVDQNKPLILLMWYSEAHVYGHYRVVTGYNETHIFLHDPWALSGKYGGPNIVLNYTLFSDLWSYSGNWTLYVSPWIVNISAPAYIKPEMPFQVNVTIVYPEPLPNALVNYNAASCNATITLPQNLSLIAGEIPKKMVGSGFLEAGANATVNWTLVADNYGVYTIGIEVEGLVSGHVWPHDGYPEYDYSDRIGAKVNFTIEFMEDSRAPILADLSRFPSGDVEPGQEVKISVNVTDPESGVKNVTLFCTTNDGASWENKTMNLNQTTKLYEATIPGQLAKTWVKFKIVAYDYLENNATLDGVTPQCMYYVIPEFLSSTAALLLFIMFTIFFIVYLRRKKQKSPNAFTSCN
ncbi:MAG: C39 family peptidase [Candidatus Bathyarchaeota archaeon]|nr:C39 family peptidase [Candidatus Bathyarchaeota archaeon]